MIPLQFETGFLLIVRHILLTLDRTLIAEQERAAITVALDIVRRCRKAPRALGIDLAQQFEVHLIGDGEIIATITQVETTTGLITIGRHDQTTTITLGEGEESIRNRQRQRHVSHHEVGGSEDHILARTHLRA